jgi:hypothetical protein
MSNLPKRVDELIDELHKSANLTNKKRLDELVRTRASVVPAVQGGVMNVESMVASKTKLPMVIFKWNDNRGELSPVEARGYAMQILEACEAATQDAALYTGIVETMGLEDNKAFAMINLVRDHRRKLSKRHERTG